MFTVKLATGKTFAATAAEEGFGSVYGGSPQFTLRLECTPAEKGIGEYLALLEEKGALDALEVLVEGKPCLSAQGYTNVVELTQRLLPTGEKHLALVLSRPIAAEGTD